MCQLTVLCYTLVKIFFYEYEQETEKDYGGKSKFERNGIEITVSPFHYKKN